MKEIKEKNQVYKLKINENNYNDDNCYNLDLNIDKIRCKGEVDAIINENGYGPLSQRFFRQKKIFKRLFTNVSVEEPVGYGEFENFFFESLSKSNYPIMYHLFIKKLKFKIIQKRVLGENINVIENINDWKKHQDVDEQLNYNHELLDYLEQLILFINMRIVYLNPDIDSLYQLYNSNLKKKRGDPYGVRMNFQLENKELKKKELQHQKYLIGLTNQNFLDEYINRQSEFYRLEQKKHPLIGGHKLSPGIQQKLKHGNNMIVGLMKFIDKKFTNKFINLISKKNKCDHIINL